MDLAKNLIDFGLSEKEAKAYLALLELEVATAHEVATKADINRSSAYVILDGLCQKGLASVSAGEPTKKYVPSSPDLLAEKAAEALLKQQTVERGIDRILPELRSLFKDTKHRPKVRVFEGAGGLISAMREPLMSREKSIRAFTSGEVILSVIPDFMYEWLMLRVQGRLNITGIYVDNPATRKLINFKTDKGEGVFVPKENYPFPVDVMIWDDKVGYLIVEGKSITTIIVEGKEIGLVMKSMFDLAFERAKEKGEYFKYR